MNDLVVGAGPVELRGLEHVSPRVAQLFRNVRAHIEPTLRDRPMDADIVTARELVRRGLV